MQLSVPLPPPPPPSDETSGEATAPAPPPAPPAPPAPAPPVDLSALGWRILSKPIGKSKEDRWGKKGSLSVRCIVRVALASDVLVERPKHAGKGSFKREPKPKQQRQGGGGRTARQGGGATAAAAADEVSIAHCVAPRPAGRARSA